MPLPTPIAPTASALSSTNTLPKIGAIYRAVGWGHVKTRLLNEAASQTYDRGELVSLNASGAVTNLGTAADPSANAVSASMSASAQGTPSTLVAGMALKAAGNLSAATTSIQDAVPVVEASAHVEFLMRVYNATRTSAEVQDVAVGDAAELFRYAGASISTTVRDCQTVISAAPNGTDGINKVVITNIPREWAATDQYPPVWCMVRSEACAFL